MINSLQSASAAQCPVMGESYRRTLAVARRIEPEAARLFLSQWHSFSAAMPEMLSICAVRASSETERANIVANLYSELGLDGDGVSHPALLADLIVQATGEAPDDSVVTAATRDFISQLKATFFAECSAYNAGTLLALEAIAYQILGVLKEILVKSGNETLVTHPYITIHEEIEAMHIENTESNIAEYKHSMDRVSLGRDMMMARWAAFWDNAYVLLVNPA